MEQAMAYLKNKGNVFVMWDIFSKQPVTLSRILSNKYPKFEEGKNEKKIFKKKSHIHYRCISYTKHG